MPGTWHPSIDVNAVTFDSEPLPGLAVGDAKAAVRKYVSDDIAMLIRRLEMCSNCLQEFPVSMDDSSRFSKWAEAMDHDQFRIGGPITRGLVLDRVLTRCCPRCGVPASERMASGQIVHRKHL